MKRRKWDVAAPQAVSGSAASPQAAVVPGIAPMALPSSAIPGGLPNAGAGAPARLSGGVDLQMIQRIQAQAAAVASRLNQVPPPTAASLFGQRFTETAAMGLCIRRMHAAGCFLCL
jgi:hypothetical protein